MNRAALAAALAFFPLVAMGAIKAERVPELRPPRPELPPPMSTGSRSAWVIGGLGVAILLAALCWPHRKPPAPPPESFAVAQEKLGALRANAGSTTPAAVSAIMRRYAAGAFGIEGGGLTSEELVSGLVARRSCPVELTNAVWRFLSDCDRAKFSQGVKSPNAPALIGSAAKLIDELEAARAKAARTL